MNAMANGACVNALATLRQRAMPNGTLAAGNGYTANSALTPPLRGNGLGQGDAFVDKLAAPAQAASAATGIPARFIIGQAALESGWGKREIKNADGSSSHNVFGIKATERLDRQDRHRGHDRVRERQAAEGGREIPRLRFV